MQPFTKAYYPEMPPERVDALAAAFGVTRDEVIRVMEIEQRHATVWMNDVYQVSKRVIRDDEFPADAPSMIHLSIKRIDRAPIHDWRDLQEIKNALVGPEYEMWECYPKESHKVDTANQYHLWGFLTYEKIIPFGFCGERKVIDHDPEIEKATNTKQRKL